MADSGNPDVSADRDRPRGEPLSEVFPIIGIGASAGGLEAFSQLLSKLPPDTGMAFVLVQHLDPRHESKLGDILAKSSEMPVLEGTQGMSVRRNHVYIIPPNATMTLVDGNLVLAAREVTHTPHLPIDHFFKSLAADRPSGAVGVILSGTGSDGTLGLEEIKAAGGITFAQDELTAKYPGMPQSAVRSGCVDVVLPPDGIAAELVRISQHPYLAPDEIEKTEKPSRSEEQDFHRILALLRTSAGVDFSAYRDTTIRRRIMRRLVLHTKDSLTDYADILEHTPAELEALYQDLLINVTSFFREPEAFEALKKLVFPEILRNRSSLVPIRIWVPGCSTGQESYSLAIVLLEYLEEKNVRAPIQIFATDLSDTVSLHKAREGVYPGNIEAEVTPERLRRFFVKEDGKYRINKSIRDLCVIAKQNVAADPPFSRVDLISCRNLLIYLAPPLQRRVIPTFHYALNPQGFLLLGSSETVGSFSDLFSLVDQKSRIYAKKPSASRAYPHFKLDELQLARASAGLSRSSVIASPVEWQREADRLVLGQYSPVGVLVNDNFDVLQFRGQTGRYLNPPTGEASFNVLKMAREGLFLELRNALNEARQTNADIRRDGVRVRNELGVEDITFHIRPVRLPGVAERCFLILFGQPPLHEQTESDESGTASKHAGKKPGESRSAKRRAHSTPEGEREIAQIRQELNSTRDYLQSVIEQQDAGNEELKSANEEILSSNEELQSTNEELETAKEELQSVNEELTTINEQLRVRNAELSRLNDDISNLLGSANVPMVALGIDLRIRRFTPAAAKLMNLLPSDVGRPISNLKLSVEVPDFEKILSEVVDTVRLYELEVQDNAGRWYHLRIHPFRTAENKIEGTVVVLHDIDKLKSQAARLRLQNELIDLSPDAIIRCDAKTRTINYWNLGAQRTYGWSEEEAVGKVIHELLKTSPSPDSSQVDAILQRDGSWEGELTYTHRNGSTIAVDSRQVLYREKGEPLAILEINRDITERKRMERGVKDYAAQLAEADRHKDEFLAMLAHELRNPLTPVRNALNALRLLDAKGDFTEAPALREMVERQVRHMAVLIDDLLDVPRMTQGRIKLRKAAVNLCDLTRQVVGDAGLLAGNGREFVMNMPKQEIWLEADPDRLAQILENLVTNAIKYSPPDSRVELTVSHEEKEAVITVKDAGIGISEEMLPRVWELFTRVDNSLERSRGGLGIGLTLVKYLVELHQGNVGAKSAGLGKGSEFWVRLPAGNHSPESSAAPARAREKSPAAQPQSYRILVVDDNADSVKSLQLLLELIGHNVRVASNGAEALEVAAQFNPEVVVLDLGLPVMSGYEVARKLRQTDQGRDMMVIALSGYESPETRQRTGEAGFNAHFVKPVDIDALMESIQKLRR
jgi:two-component system, chemotaxis family, CheB/CheR fusion protein